MFIGAVDGILELSISHEKSPISLGLENLDILQKSCSAQRVKQKIREETIPLNHDSCSNSEPYGCNNRCCGEELFHGLVMSENGLSSERSAWRNGDFVIALNQLAAGEFTEGSNWPCC